MNATAAALEARKPALPAPAPSARAPFAGSQRMDILLFSLGGDEIFGINVFKVREVALTPKITRTPNTAAGLEGVIALRGGIIPVIDVARVAGLEAADADYCSTLLVTELCGRTQGLLVSGVDRIVRVDWDRIEPPAAALLENGIVTAITRLPDARLVSIIDVEQILARSFGESRVPDLERLGEGAQPSVLFADDSPVARHVLTRVLDQLGVSYHQASNGREAWEKLQAMATQAQLEGARMHERLGLILTDAEMPQMDGHTLARCVRADPRFEAVPIVMHTALSTRVTGTPEHGRCIDAYIPKSDPIGLAEALRPMLQTKIYRQLAA